jgi:hypothetical protein
MHEQLRKHDWVYEVLLDLSKYAQKNRMPQLLRQIENSLENLEPELGSAGKLSELRVFFDSIQREKFKANSNRARLRLVSSTPYFNCTSKNPSP